MDTTQTAGHRPHLLVVDDEPHIAELLRLWFELSGYDVTTAGSGTAALAQIDVRRPAAIVLDLMLPGIDGLEVLRRARETCPGVPVVVCSACDPVEERALAAAAAADAFYLKPFSLLDLDRTLRDLVRSAAAAV